MKTFRKLTLAGAFLFTLGCTSAEDPAYVLPDEAQDELWSYTEINGQKIGSIAVKDTLSVSFWLKPETNFTDSTVFSVGMEDAYILCTNRGLNGENFSGLTLSAKTDKGESWAVADGDQAPLTNRWNHITVNLTKKKAELYLNGEKVSEADFIHPTGTMNLFIGDDPLGLRDITGMISGFTVSPKLLTAEEIRTEYEENLAAVLLDTVSYPDSDHLSRDLWFADNTVEGYPLQWVRDENTVLMDDFGRRTGTQAGTAVYTASLHTERSEAEKTFVFTLAGEGDEELLEQDLKALDAAAGGTMFSGTEMPAEGRNGTVYTYQVTSGNAYLDGTRLIKDTDNEREKVTFTVQAERNGQREEKTYSTVLLDEAYGYAMLYFNGDVDTEITHIALSRDGVTWTGMPQTVSSRLYTDETFGTMRLRDPHISRDENGAFLIAATEGGDHPYIYLYRSEELTDFNTGYRLLVSYPDASLGMTGQKAWAPEVYYDNEKGEYLIYFADHREDRGPVYVIRTSLHTDTEGRLIYTYPDILFDPGYPVIDSTIFVNNGQYWMVYKDEREAAQTVYAAVTDDLTLGFRKAYDWKYLQTQRPVEGPMVFADIETGEYHLYLDHFSDHTFLAGRFTGLDYDHEVNWQDTAFLQLPEEDVRHGSVIPITEKEYARIQESYK